MHFDTSPIPSRPRSRPTGYYDAIVVGARAAGAATAMLLARRGLRVLAVDKGHYGSDTLSSHALMRGAVTRLHRWGLLDRVWAAGTPVITRASFRYGDDGYDVDVPASDELPGLAAPRRTVLDPILVDAARDAGAHVLHRARLLDLVRDTDGRVRGAKLWFDDGTTCLVTADLVIGADGRQSAVAKHVNAPITREGDHASAYVLRYVTGLDAPDDAYRWMFRPGLGAGVIPTNDATWCVFAALPPERFAAERHDPGAAMQRVLDAVDPDLARSFATAGPAGPLRTWPGVRGRFRQAHGPGWALVGDAGYFKDPFAAHGISDAFRDAELLTEAVVDGDLARYERLRDELSAPLFEVLERFTAYDWDLTTLPDLHLRLSRAMRDEDLATEAARHAAV
jgi:flavin-dependent dehydrogenase